MIWIPELLVAATPFLVVGALLRLAGRLQERRELRLSRQIALTDAIHRKLGAAAAPQVTRGWNGTWTVTMAVPLRREILVGTLTRITHDFFSGVDGITTPRLQILLTEREPTTLRPRSAGASPGLRLSAASHAGERAA
jgi:hypothetical protein